jgi:HK97 family phage major capsid protein
MSEDTIKLVQEEIKKSFEELKETNDARLAEFEKKGAADALVEEKTQKINDHISDLEEKLAKVEAAATRPATPSKEEEKASAAELEAKAINQWARANRQHTLAEFIDNKEEFKALSVGSNADGGFLVMPEFGGVLEGQIFETSPLRQIATVVNGSSDSLELVDDNDEASGGWVTETGTRSNTDTPTLDKITIPAHALYAQPITTQKMLDDSIVDVSSWLSRKAADKLARIENTTFIAGDGVGKPKGILSYTAASAADTYQANAIGQIASGSSGAFTADGILKLVYGVKAQYRANGTFILSRSGIQAVRLLKEATTNAYMWQASLQAGQPQLLAGYPILECSDIPVAAANSLSGAFGDFRRGYTIYDRKGVSILRDPYTTKGYVKFYMEKRTGGGVTNFEAFNLLKLAA